MRVITGSARGSRLTTLEGDSVRPTPERVKEALFSAIQFQIEGRRVLDLFAGSGQLGIEALSRGAKQTVFVDASKNSIAVVQKNLEHTGLAENAVIKTMDFAAFLLQNRERFDLAFLDPPYRTGLLQRALPMTADVMNQGGTIICENPRDEDMPETAGDFIRVRSYRHGKIQLTLYRHKDVTEQ
ncbi:16S rRNA (guanine(966)-N(2))-methyltransferase RsmD [Caproiciproducens sp.]|uniref:16S rRNA (guanine(966)-N(2))-methyltransferase RsmD n=1 Tax=Caproiciproducens sp. TaxID=1954376 RepID=UPI0028A1FBF0|nr:16S rRNA (guanine(966)-N(2))-methyltransferase RsmD [Caproiciproducens sp.]